MRRVQDRILASAPQLDATSAKELLRQIKKCLNDASDEGLLKTAQQDIHRYVQLEASRTSEHQIVGGIKDFARRPESARLVRDDGAWLHFTLTVRATKRGSLELVAYNFELVFPGDHVPPFVRLDLNPPGHENDARSMRSHMHPGHAELQLPAPMMTPGEILGLMLHRLRPRDGVKPRA